MSIENKTIRLKFVDSEGKKFSLSMGYPSAALEEEGGAEIAQEAVDTLLETQTFERGIAECTGVEVVDRKVTKII